MHISTVKNTNKQLKAYMFSYLDIITTISSIMLIRANTEESLQKKKELLEYIRTENKQVYRNCVTVFSEES